MQRRIIIPIIVALASVSVVAAIMVQASMASFTEADARRLHSPSPVLLTASTDRIAKGQQSDEANSYTNNEEPLIYGTVSKSILDTNRQVTINVYYPDGTLYLQKEADVSPSDGYYGARIPMDSWLTEDSQGQFMVKVSYGNETAETGFRHLLEYNQDLVYSSSLSASRPAEKSQYYSYMTLTMTGMKEEYAVGEPIDFTLNVEGYGIDCPEAPSMTIRNESSVVWAYETVNLMGCRDPDSYAPHEIIESWNVKQRLSMMSESSISQPTINYVGNYTLSASYYGRQINHQFVVS